MNTIHFKDKRSKLFFLIIQSPMSHIAEFATMETGFDRVINIAPKYFAAGRDLKPCFDKNANLL